MLSRLFLTGCGILYLGFGLGVLLAPESGVSGFWGGDPSPGALGDLHGSHGGMNLAIGLFSLFAAMSPVWHRPGLLLIALVNGGYLTGRLIAVAGQGTMSPALIAIIGLEATLLVAAILLAMPRLRPRRRLRPADRTAAVPSRWGRRHV
jgi:hypothetical protein